MRICSDGQLCTRISEDRNAAKTESRLWQPKAKPGSFCFHFICKEDPIKQQHWHRTPTYSPMSENLSATAYLECPHTGTNSPKHFNYLKIKIYFTVVTNCLWWEKTRTGLLHYFKARLAYGICSSFLILSFPNKT